MSTEPGTIVTLTEGGKQETTLAQEKQAKMKRASCLRKRPGEEILYERQSVGTPKPPHPDELWAQ